MNIDMLIKDATQESSVPPNPSDTNVQKLIDEIKKSEEGGVLPQTTPVIVPVRSESYSEPNECFPSVKEKIKRDGGARVLGWTLRKEKLFMSAEFHAVWESPNKELLDVTPKGMLSPIDPTKNIIIPTENILFIAAPKAIYEEKQKFSIHFNFSGNPLADDMINCKRGEFYLMNKGERALQHGEIELLGKEVKEYQDIQETSMILQRMVDDGRKSYNSKCGCQSGEKYKRCHGKTLRKIIEKGR